ncbi:alcohol oxidase [Serendipita vermifera]|nr:alcohol oxidase [Serendipita vermifera]
MANLLSLSTLLAASVIPVSASALIERAIATDPSAFSSQSFDYVVVGAGTAGLALASRLAADGSTKVGIIEAGQYLPNDPLIDVPKNFGRNNNDPKYDWRFNTTPQAELSGRTVPHPRGKVVGGSSALNYLVFNRGSKAEYDAWAEIGNDGWGWDSLTPSFKASSNYTAIKQEDVFPGALSANESTAQEASFVGTEGTIQVSYNDYYTDVSQPYVLAMNALGVSTNSAPDTGNQTGVYNAPTAVNRTNGKRSYAAAYYEKNADKSNFSLLTGAQATKINFSGTKQNDKVVATGVSFQVNGQTYTVNASREVILSAGAFQSPQLLELSGIGSSGILGSLGIPVVVDLPGVGENLQDHAMSGQLWQVNPGVETWDQLRINTTFAQQAAQQYNATHDGPLASTISTITFLNHRQVAESQTEFDSMMTNLDEWINSTNPSGLTAKQYDIQKRWIKEGSAPGMEIVLVPQGGLTRTRPANETSYVVISAILQHPFSRGSVHINSTNPLDYPLVDPKYLTSPFDTEALVAGLQFVNRLATTEPFSNLLATRIDPATNFTTAEHFEGYLKASLQSIKHPVGTCAMAPKDLGGVVDSSLRVWGTANLRVVDASIIPSHVAAHTQSTVYAIAEKAASIIQGGNSNGAESRFGRPTGWWTSVGVSMGAVALLFTLF